MLKRSTIFFTFHKCASTLFKNFVLPNLTGLEQVDYATQLYREGDAGMDLDFSNPNKIYGPVRLSAGKKTPLHSRVIEPLLSEGALSDVRSIIFTRDPRDIIVSSYYSFSKTHSLSPNPIIRDKQLKQREKISKLTIDQFAIKNAELQRFNFQRAVHVAESSGEVGIFRYEDMIDNWEGFIDEFKSMLPISNEVEEEWYQQCRPKALEDVTSHRRSGKTKAFREKLSQATVAEVNSILESPLRYFNYED